eukprot:56415-Prorocentrum_minimum.AAC.1
MAGVVAGDVVHDSSSDALGLAALLVALFALVFGALAVYKAFTSGKQRPAPPPANQAGCVPRASNAVQAMRYICVTGVARSPGDALHLCHGRRA